jgi:hypothetical protein
MEGHAGALARRTSTSRPLLRCQDPARVIGVRVGRLLVCVADREALSSLLDAWGQVEALADKAFGPELPPAFISNSDAASHG